LLDSLSTKCAVCENTTVGIKNTTAGTFKPGFGIFSTSAGTRNTKPWYFYSKGLRSFYVSDGLQITGGGVLFRNLCALH
jgi:hypothetical protein